VPCRSTINSARHSTVLATPPCTREMPVSSGDNAAAPPTAAAAAAADDCRGNGDDDDDPSLLTVRDA